MLSLTGLDPQTLRENLGEPGTLRALLDFVLDHEPDLKACAAEIGVGPRDIAAARHGLERGAMEQDNPAESGFDAERFDGQEFDGSDYDPSEYEGKYDGDDFGA